MYTSPDSVELQ